MEDMALLRDFGKRVGVKVVGKKADDAKVAVMKGILDAANKAKTTKDGEWVRANKDLIDWYNANCEAPEPEKGAAPEAKAETKAPAKKGGAAASKKDALAAAKAKAEAAKAKAAEEKSKRPAGGSRKSVSNKKGTEWKEGSNAQDIFLLIKGAGKKGITLEEGVAAAKKGKVNSSALDARVKAIFAEAVQREIATKNGDKYVIA